ncbi:arginine deiminase family protein [Sphingomonas sp.]|uniref:dimethylarginine dimethylaminohydrolase family protein n=1 Tax=Sphingomonas sp. TaxID=28214 RepID=UPI00286C8457|nr:arginine deiminase family protein [Sphingomonas sp.]
MPADTVDDGLSASGGRPTYDGVLAEHAAYVSALRTASITVIVLPPLAEFPDSLFVEDPALVFTEGAILLRPGAPSRVAEAGALAPTLHEHFDVVLDLPSGHADGGDVLVTGKGVMIGLSDRTDQAGAEALAGCLARFGRLSTIVETPDDVLHLKSACSLLDEDTVLSTPALAATGIFDGFRQVMTPDGEDAAANALRVNDVVLVGAGFPKTIALLGQLGYAVMALPTSEIGKIDAGLSCMSLRWWSA